MFERAIESSTRKQQKQTMETRRPMERIAGLTVVTTVAAAIAALIATAVYAQDKYSLKSPSGIAFSDFRGCEASALIFSAGPTKCSK